MTCGGSSASSLRASDVGRRRLVPGCPAVPRALREPRATVSGPRQHAGVRRSTSLRAHVDFVGSSEGWGVEKPAPEFFARIVELAVLRLRRSRTWATASTTTSSRRSPPGWSPCTSDEAPGVTFTSRRPSALRIRSLDELPRPSREPARRDRGRCACARARSAARPRRRPARLRPRPRRPLRRRRARARAHRCVLGAAGLGDIGALFPSGDEQLPRRLQPRPVARGVPAGARGGLAARERRLRAGR